jgi:UDP-glucose 4-epimerase
MKTILITGNSGYIGSHLTNLLNQKYNIIGLDLATNKATVTNHLQLDIRNLPDLDFEFDVVIHLAALVKVNESVINPIQYYSTNINGTLKLLHKIKNKSSNFIFASTGNSINYTTFRFYNVIGSSGFSPTNPDGLFYNLLQAKQRGVFTIFGSDYNTKDGTAVRDYVHVDEICSAIEKAIDAPANKIENLGHGQGHTVKEIVELFQTQNNCEFEVKYGPRRAGDLERSVLKNPSHYLNHIYGMEDLVKIPTSML